MDLNILELSARIEQETSVQQKAGKLADFSQIIELIKRHIFLSEQNEIVSPYFEQLQKIELLQSKLIHYRQTGEFEKE